MSLVILNYEPNFQPRTILSLLKGWQGSLCFMVCQLWSVIILMWINHEWHPICWLLSINEFFCLYYDHLIFTWGLSRSCTGFESDFLLSCICNFREVCRNLFWDLPCLYVFQQWSCGMLAEFPIFFFFTLVINGNTDEEVLSREEITPESGDNSVRTPSASLRWAHGYWRSQS